MNENKKIIIHILTSLNDGFSIFLQRVDPQTQDIRIVDINNLKQTGDRSDKEGCKYFMTRYNNKWKYILHKYLIQHAIIIFIYN